MSDIYLGYGSYHVWLVDAVTGSRRLMLDLEATPPASGQPALVSVLMTDGSYLCREYGFIGINTPEASASGGSQKE